MPTGSTMAPDSCTHAPVESQGRVGGWRWEGRDGRGLAGFGSFIGPTKLSAPARGQMPATATDKSSPPAGYKHKCLLLLLSACSCTPPSMLF